MHKCLTIWLQFPSIWRFCNISVGIPATARKGWGVIVRGWGMERNARLQFSQTKKSHPFSKLPVYGDQLQILHPERRKREKIITSRSFWLIRTIPPPHSPQSFPKLREILRRVLKFEGKGFRSRQAMYLLCYSFFIVVCSLIEESILRLKLV